LSKCEELFGTTSFDIVALRSRVGGSKIQVISAVRRFGGDGLVMAKFTNQLGLSCLNRFVLAGTTTLLHFPSLAMESYPESPLMGKERRSCPWDPSRKVCITKGVHFWEVKLEHLDMGSVLIVFTEKPSGAYGDHCHTSDTVGVLLDDDAG
jgi:hypothetical protein